MSAKKIREVIMILCYVKYCTNLIWNKTDYICKLNKTHIGPNAVGTVMCLDFKECPRNIIPSIT